MGNDNLYLILSNQRVSYNKNELVYKFSNICHVRKKSNRPTFKYNICNNLSHLEPYLYEKLNDLR